MLLLAQFTLMEVELQEETPLDTALQQPITYLVAGLLIALVIGLVLYVRQNNGD